MPSLTDEQISQLKSEGYSLQEILEADGYSPDEIGSVTDPSLSSGPVSLAPVDLNSSLETRADLPTDYEGASWQAGINEGIGRQETDKLMAEGINQAAGVSTNILLETAGGLLAPQLKVTKALPFIGRAGRYAVNALGQAVGMQAGNEISQQLDSAPSKTISQDLEQIKNNTITGAVIPTAMDAVGSAANFLKGLFNKPAHIAKQLGATPTDLNPEVGKFIQPKVEQLMSNSDFFNKQILTSSDPIKQYASSKAYKQQLGKQIGDFYRTNPAIPVFKEDILNSKGIQDLIKVRNDPFVSAATRKEASDALEIFNSLPQGETFNLADIWRLRQDLDSQLVSSLYKKGTGEVTNLSEYIKDTSDAVRGAMESGIAKAVARGELSAEVAEKLLKAKQEFSNLSPIVEILGRKTGQVSSQRIIDKIPTDLRTIGLGGLAAYNPVIATTVAGVLGLKSEAFRAFSQRAGLAGQNITNLASLISPYSGVGSALFKRTTDLSQISSTELSSAVFQKLAPLIGPEAAQAEALQIDETLTNGNPELKKQVITALSMNMPDLFEPPQEGVITVDNQYINPFDKDSIVKNSLDSSPAERAMRIGKSFENKYVPPSSTPQPVQLAPTIQSPDVDMIMNSFDGSFEMDNSYNSGISEMNNELKLNQLIHAQDF